MKKKILKELNPSQQEAVTHGKGPLLILAGAGSGKTRTIAHRIAYLIDELKVRPFTILAVTFTNKAANEMKTRIETLIKEGSRGLWIGTFHSICLRILKMEIENLEGFKANFTIFDEQDQIKLIRECLKKLDLSDRVFEPRSVRSKIDGIKNKGIQLSEIDSEILDDRLEKIFNLYEEELRRHNGLDFSDLLSLTVKLFEQCPKILDYYQRRFNHILVDEYQDTNNLQYKIVKYLAEKKKNIFVVGDDNQSIYSWRGADIRNILSFENDFKDCRVIKLERNYRSTKNILELSNELIKHNIERKEKTLWTENSQGELIEYYGAEDERDEARNLIDIIESEKKENHLSYNDFAIFYRTNSQSKPIEDDLIFSGTPYTIVGGVGFYQRTEVKDIIAYLRLIINNEDNLSLKRIINVPGRGIGKVTVGKLETIASDNNVSILNAINYSLENKIFSKNTHSKLKDFYGLISKFTELSNELSAQELIEEILEETNYLDYVESEEERLSNISDLVTLASDFDEEDDQKLNDFLDWVSLASDIDKYDQSNDRVTLMTLHTAKGLEYPVVLITGLEEGLLPHFRSISDSQQLEEERRLFYVGITRAKSRLYLSSAYSRRYFGKDQRSNPSRFLGELPLELMKCNTFDDLYDYRNLKHKSSSLTDEGIELNYIESPDKESRLGNHNLNKGQGVEHSVFGKGIILKVEGNDENAKVTVMFRVAGKKTILASFLE